MTVIDVKVPASHPAQRGIDLSSASYGVLVCGRRWGKTTLCEKLLVRASLTTGLPYGYFAPTYKLMANVWRDLKRILKPVIADKSEVEKRIELINGGAIEFWSLDDTDAGRGRKYAGVVIDEAAIVPKLQEAWEDSVKQTLLDYSGGAIFASTPKGRNYFWQMYQRGVDPEQKDWTSWQYPTSTNPYIKPEDIERARLELPESTFRQEYLAEFLEGEGAVFRRVAECATAEPVQPYRGEFIAGVDWGKQADFTAIVVLDRETGAMVDMDRFNQIDY
ncbi:hypothetical protein GF380_03380, partial [Candidatus Uhrbacteria bacterium]|nr:hypothetical protein [Candidatus Uhrbacteria bacterium]